MCTNDQCKKECMCSDKQNSILIDMRNTCRDNIKEKHRECYFIGKKGDIWSKKIEYSKTITIIKSRADIGTNKSKIKPLHLSN